MTLSGEGVLIQGSGAGKGSGGKPIIKIQKLNPCLLTRRENSLQCTPPRAHLPWGLGWLCLLESTKLERWGPGVFSVPVYSLLEPFLCQLQMWTFHFTLHSTFSSWFWYWLTWIRQCQVTVPAWVTLTQNFKFQVKFKLNTDCDRLGYHCMNDTTWMLQSH